jgi:hypothetical protein
MPDIPIPERLAARPVRSGLVVPYISLETDGRVMFGQTRGIRVGECIVNGLCQTCGQRLGPKMVFAVTERMLADRFTGEPAMHPECAAYSAKACPMIGGRMAAYAPHPKSVTGQPCDVPGCDCGGWVSGSTGKAGSAAVPWFTAWFTGYDIAVKDADAPLTVENVLGCALTQEPLKVRPIAPARAEP